MKSYIIYIKGHQKSEEQANSALLSFLEHGWDVSLKEGVTPHSLKEIPHIIENSRLWNFKEENFKKYMTKISCATNHINFWKEVVEANEPMCFLEHDAVCLDKCPNVDFKDYLILNIQYAFRPPSKIAWGPYLKVKFEGEGLKEVDDTYILRYHKENIWKGSYLVPGTGAYAITPQGAQKMLNAISKYGIDQSDFMLNSFNLDLEYYLPSPVKFNNVNLSTSFGV
jgi:GR25 family glycosyltransferase involved in LPS biosynthesis